MNYFEIINKVLIELNYDSVSSFADLTRLEHKRLMNIINRLNKEICNLNDKFHFRQMIKEIKLSEDRIEYSLNISGKIMRVLGEQGEYSYHSDYTDFYSSNPPMNAFCAYGEDYLFSPVNERIKVFYTTNCFVKDINGDLKTDFEKETDKTIIPDNFVEKLFINGAAYNFKQNTAHPKYTHWKNEYNLAIAELLAMAKNISGLGLSIDGGFRKL